MGSSKTEKCVELEAEKPVLQTILKSSAAGSAKLQLQTKTSHFVGVEPKPKLVKVDLESNKVDAYRNVSLLLSSRSSTPLNCASRTIQSNVSKDFVLHNRHQSSSSLVSKSNPKTYENSEIGNKNEKQVCANVIQSQHHVDPTISTKSLVYKPDLSNSNCSISNTAESENSYELSFDESRGQGALSSNSPLSLPLVTVSSSKSDDTREFTLERVSVNAKETETESTNYSNSVLLVPNLPSETRQIDLDLIELANEYTKTNEFGIGNIGIEAETKTHSSALIETETGSTGTSSSTSFSGNDFGIPNIKNQQGLLAGLITTSGKKNTVNIYVTQCFNCQGQCVRQRVSLVSDQPLKINSEVLQPNHQKVLLSHPNSDNKQPAKMTPSPLLSVSNNNQDQNINIQDKLDENLDGNGRGITPFYGVESETSDETTHFAPETATATTTTEAIAVGLTTQLPAADNQDTDLFLTANNVDQVDLEPKPKPKSVRHRRRHRPVINKKRRVAAKKQPIQNQQIKSVFIPDPLQTSANDSNYENPIASSSKSSVSASAVGVESRTGIKMNFKISEASASSETGKVKSENFKDLYWTASSEDKKSIIYQCKKCQFNGSSDDLPDRKLKEHFLKHYQPNLFVCQNQQCSKSYETTASLKRHYTTTAHGRFLTNARRKKPKLLSS